MAGAMGGSSIAGSIVNGAGTCSTDVQGATVVAEGTGFSATTDGSCAFTLSGLPTGSYDLVGIRTGFSDRRFEGVNTGAPVSPSVLIAGLWWIRGDSTAACSFTGPMMGSRGVPGSDTNFKMFVAFDKAMSESSLSTVGNLTVNEVSTTEPSRT